MPFRPRLALAALASLSALTQSPAAHASCGSAFCSLSTDFGADAIGLTEGGRLDLRYEQIDQRQPRAGSRKVGVGDIPADHDEVSTRNRNLIATYSRNYASGWGFSMAAPLVDRQHFHLRNEDDGGQLPQRWSFTELGDVRITGRYQRVVSGLGESNGTGGLTFGVKLPTGRFDVANADGDVAERSLQPGSGTIDAIVGAFVNQPMPASSSSWFAQAQLQHALDTRDGFRPGHMLTADVGYAKVLSDKVSGIVQLNAVVKGRDQGVNAEPGDSGGRFLYASPGLSYDISPAMRAYAFVQQPLHQYVNGVQLTADRSFVIGMSTRF
jgi:hypothetical protein